MVSLKSALLVVRVAAAAAAPAAAAAAALSPGSLKSARYRDTVELIVTAQKANEGLHILH